ncbi:MAG: hypothetical protein K6T39_10020, partial [Anoxybacillus ayderensis]|nr:hypothetical protein [Anoxybacillus ayderensis]
FNVLINLSEDKLFWFSAIVFLISITFIISLFVLWGKHGFSNIDFTTDTVFFIVIGTFGIEIISTIIFSHLIKRIKGV